MQARQEPLATQIERAILRNAGLFVIVEDDGRVLHMTGLVDTPEARQAAEDVALEFQPADRERLARPEPPGTARAAAGTGGRRRSREATRGAIGRDPGLLVAHALAVLVAGLEEQAEQIVAWGPRRAAIGDHPSHPPLDDRERRLERARPLARQAEG